MKVARNYALALLISASSCSAFIAPSVCQSKTTFGVSQKCKTSLNNKPFFASEPEPKQSAPPTPKNVDVEDEEFERLVEAEIAKTRKMSNLRNEKGVDYAPWMAISEEDEAEIRKIMKAKTVARRLREEQQRSVSGSLYLDSQAQELSGTGLKAKIIDEDVELEWATKSETDTKGFVVKRRAAKTDEFVTIASFENWGPLQSQGKEGGIYRYLDTEVPPGGWVYRVAECDNAGTESDLCQCLVEVQTKEEQQAAVIAAVSIGVLAVLAVVAGLVLDPLNGS